MQTFVEFYLPGVSVAGQHEKEVSSRNHEAIESFPDFAISYRFFNKTDEEEKINYSPYYYIGEAFSIQDFKNKYPQLAEDFGSEERILKAVTGGFYPISDEDIVVSA